MCMPRILEPPTDGFLVFFRSLPSAIAFVNLFFVWLQLGVLLIFVFYNSLPLAPFL